MCMWLLRLRHGTGHCTATAPRHCTATAWAWHWHCTPLTLALAPLCLSLSYRALRLPGPVQLRQWQNYLTPWPRPTIRSHNLSYITCHTRDTGQNGGRSNRRQTKRRHAETATTWTATTTVISATDKVKTAKFASGNAVTFGQIGDNFGWTLTLTLPLTLILNLNRNP